MARVLSRAFATGAAAAFAALAALVACGGAGDVQENTIGDIGDVGDTGGLPAGGTGGAGSTVAPVTTVPPPTTVPPADPACPLVTVPATAANLTVRTGDFDGDGLSDELRSFFNAGAWRLQVSLAAGGGHTLEVEPEGGAGVTAVGGFDVDEDGAQEAWARVGSGAGNQVVGLFRLERCTLAPVTVDEKGARFSVGGTFDSRAGVECAAPGTPTFDLTTFSGYSEDARVFTVVRTTYRLEGAALTAVGSEVTSDPSNSRIFTFGCGALTP